MLWAFCQTFCCRWGVIGRHWWGEGFSVYEILDSISNWTLYNMSGLPRNHFLGKYFILKICFVSVLISEEPRAACLAAIVTNRTVCCTLLLYIIIMLISFLVLLSVGLSVSNEAVLFEWFRQILFRFQYVFPVIILLSHRPSFMLTHSMTSW